MYPLLPIATPIETVYYWENFFSDEELNIILALPHWIQASQAKVGIGGGSLDTEKRRTQVAWLNLDNNTKWIYDRIAEVIAKVNSINYQYELSGLYESIQLGIYNETEQGHYDWHIDSGGTEVTRKLSMALLLSNPSEFEGGQLQLKVGNDDAMDVEQRKGRAWFFPSYVLHRVTPVTKGVRRSLVVWAGGPKFK